MYAPNPPLPPRQGATPSRPILGVNATDLAWDPNAKETLQAMERAGVKEVRVNMRGIALETTLLSLLQDATAHGVAAEIIIAQDPSDFSTVSVSSPLDANQFLATCGYAEDNIRPVSQTDLTLFGQRVSSYVEALANQNITVAGFEVGNEWDWACFNTDMPFAGMPTDSTMQAFLVKYAAMLAITRDAVNNAFPEGSRPPVGTFGMANAGATADNNPRPWAVLKGLGGLGNQNALASVDFVGMHMYAPPNVDITLLEQAWSVTGKPVWVTECAPSTTSGSSTPYAAMENMVNSFDEADEHVQAVLIYDWYTYFYDATSETITPLATLFGN